MRHAAQFGRTVAVSGQHLSRSNINQYKLTPNLLWNPLDLCFGKLAQAQLLVSFRATCSYLFKDRQHQPTVSMMSRAAKGLRHVVMIGVKESTSNEQILAVKEGLAALKDTCGILEFEFGTDLQLPSGQSHPAGKNRSCTWYADFPSVEAYEAYAAHPEHVKVINDLIKPIMEPGSRAAIQYER
eukprot:s2762_g10.t1